MLRIGITCRFQNSYFSGALPQVALLLGKVLKELGHDVTLLHPKEDMSWFIDIKSEEATAPRREAWTPDRLGEAKYDLLVETTWFLPVEIRPQVAHRRVLFAHYPPLFHDMESSVYPFNPLTRDFRNLTEIWTWDVYGAQDIRYLEFLSGKPVRALPFSWNFEATEAYLREGGVPTWISNAPNIESRITGETPKSMSWCARIMESNISNTSHCLLPLNIVSEIRKTAAPIRYSVHNGEYVEKNGFFQSNVAKNLVLPDLSGNFVPRIRLPDLCRDKSFLISHQRFRPIKGFLLDALYCGIPTIHNCTLLKSWGYFYELNQIREAVACWKRMDAEYGAKEGFFAAGALDTLRAQLKEAFGAHRLRDTLRKLLLCTPEKQEPHMIIQEITAAAKAATSEANAASELRVQFCDMWDQFNPEHNFFMSLLKWTGSQHGFTVRYDPHTPNLIIYGPFGEMHAMEAYAAVPKIFFTGENAPPRQGHGTFINIGFQYSPDSSYIRLPLWVLEINWFGEDVDAVANPRPVPLSAAMRQDPAVLDGKRKFCAFVASNPRCQNRNTAFHVLNQWRGVDAGGRLFCNLPGGPIPAGLGGGGGELAKVEFYKDYKYVIAFENEAAPGYTTEKLFHAKVAGCVPIYWGDKFVDRDFDSKGFLNANTVQTAEDLRGLIERLEADPAAWRRMAEVPALSEYKRHWCQRTMEELARKTVKRILGKDIQFARNAWDTCEEFHASASAAAASVKASPAATVTNTSNISPPSTPSSVELPKKRRIITAANAKFVPSVRLFVQSARRWESAETTIRVYVWPDVTAEDRKLIAAAGAEVVDLPVGEAAAWEGFWDPQHFAWKLWLHAKEAKEGESGTPVLYLDSGIDIVAPLDRLWAQIVKEDMCLIEDHHPNSRWCHPTFCQRLGVTAAEAAGLQLWAGCVGFRVGGKWSALHEDALRWAREKEVICGKKWEAYTDVCRGHRHDQSILSILTQRMGIPRLPLDARDIYCDRSRRTAENWGCCLYVHRGNPQIIMRLIEGIDEAYVINLERRRDRLEKFKENPHLKEHAYVWRATDGKTLALTTPIARLFSNNDFKWKKAVMGCALSHFGLWQKLAADPVANSYLILEDDVKFRPDWADQWKRAAPHIPTDADVIYLGGVLPPNQPSFASIVEPVNAHFAKVAKNSLFGGEPRRYFHFCNYAYVMTKQGAQKMMQLIQQRGIFTSGDHMIVNHGDGLFNIYFTTPLIASCIQEDDPVYQKSDFNNFGRLDSFDSDLWNNNEHFSQEEVVAALAEDLRKIDIKVVNEPMSEETKKRLEEEHARKLAGVAAPTAAAVQAQPQPQAAKEDKLAIWNGFLRAIARSQTAEASTSLEKIFALWNSPTAILGDMSWFRIFEQLILTSNPEMAKQKERILTFLEKHNYWNESVWKAVLKHWKVGDRRSDQSVVALNTSQVPTLRKTSIWVQKDLNMQDFWEYEWLNFLFPNGIEWRPCEFLDEIGSGDPLPVILYFNPHGLCMAKALTAMLDNQTSQGKQAILLHISDEFAANDISVYNHAAVKAVFRNYWRPGLSDKVTVLPLGYAKGRSATGLGESPAFGERAHVWSFAGSLDREGRTEILNSLQTIKPHRLATMERWGDPLALQPRDYCEMVRQTQFVPCLRGARALESFRIYEALEHGAIPVYVPADSHQTADEMRAMYGADLPFLAIPSWSEAPNILPKLAANVAVMEAHRRRVLEWWDAKKAAARSSIKAALGI